MQHSCDAFKPCQNKMKDFSWLGTRMWESNGNDVDVQKVFYNKQVLWFAKVNCSTFHAFCLFLSSLPSVFWLFLFYWFPSDVQMQACACCRVVSLWLSLFFFFLLVYKRKLRSDGLCFPRKQICKPWPMTGTLIGRKRESDNHQIASNGGHTAAITSPAHHASVILMPVSRWRSVRTHIQHFPPEYQTSLHSGPDTGSIHECLSRSLSLCESTSPTSGQRNLW